MHDVAGARRRGGGPAAPGAENRRVLSAMDSRVSALLRQPAETKPLDAIDQFLAMDDSSAAMVAPSTSGVRWRHPRELGAAEVEAFLTHLAPIDA